MKTFASITVIGKDRTGVVALVTSFLFENGANIEALEEQVTRGRFSMHLLASWTPRRFQAQLLQRELRRLGRDLRMEITVRIIHPKRRQRFGIFVSHEPQCLQALLGAARQRRLSADCALVLSNHDSLAPIARQARIPFVRIPWLDRQRAETRALRLLDQHHIDFIVLARFMKILSPTFVWRFKNKIINVHPSLLPSFPGSQAYRQAYEAGVKIVGVTAHFVTMHLDEGPIIAQDSFRVPTGMHLKEIVRRGQKLEASVLLRAIKLYLSRKLDVYWGRVREV